jgi:hypothetical protein
VLRKWFELMMANQEDLATLMTADQGMPNKVCLRGKMILGHIGPALVHESISYVGSRATQAGLCRITSY